ncbi:MAG: glycosyltransferase family 4 protein [Chloroflexi bacterium]|nr:glycosyltransferase family 4 protein [Chloroflexota bacterium]
MRIGFDATSAARQGGGIGRYVRELLRALAAADETNVYRIFVASPPPLPYPLPPLPARSSVFHLPIHDKWLARVWHRARLPIPIQLALGPLDLYHSPDFTLPPTLPGTPTLLTVHDLSFVRDPDSAAPGLKRYLDAVVPRSVRRATRVLADSEATRADLMELYRTPPEQITVLYSGVDAAFQPIADPAALAAVRARCGLGDSAFILSVGTLQPRKNYVRLIRAFAQSWFIDHCSLVIVGSRGWLYDSIFAEVTRLGLEGRVLFPGFVADDDLPALYSAARAFAYPSLYEGFGLPVLEAMACGTPVVTSTASCLPEVAGGAALLADPRDVDGLAAALRRVCEDDNLRRTLIAQGRARAREFTWGRAARQLLDIYRTMVLPPAQPRV